MNREAAIQMADDFNEANPEWECFFEGFGGSNPLVFYMGRISGDGPLEEVRIPGDSGMTLEELTDFCPIVGDTLEDCRNTLTDLATPKPIRDYEKALAALDARLQAERLRPVDTRPDAYVVGSPEAHAHPTETPRWYAAISGEASFYDAIVPDPRRISYTGHLSISFAHVWPDRYGGWEAHIERGRPSRTIHATLQAAREYVEAHVSPKRVARAIARLAAE